VLCHDRTEPSDWPDSTELCDWYDPADSIDIADAVEPRDANDATDPIDSTEPTEPTDSTESVDATESRDLWERIDHLEDMPPSSSGGPGSALANLARWSFLLFAQSSASSSCS
jgi:hypothetical protein